MYVKKMKDIFKDNFYSLNSNDMIDVITIFKNK